LSVRFHNTSKAHIDITHQRLLASQANASFDQVGPKQSNHFLVEQNPKHIKQNNVSYEVEMKAEQKRVHSKAYHAARIEAAKKGSDEKAKDLLTQPPQPPPQAQQTSPPLCMLSDFVAREDGIVVHV
jgi:hypothetical protein